MLINLFKVTYNVDYNPFSFVDKKGEYDSSYSNFS